MNYFTQNKKFYTQNATFECISPSAVEQNIIYKNNNYKRNQSPVVCYELAGGNNLIGFVLLERCIREKKEELKVTQGKHCWTEKEMVVYSQPTKFHSYRPVVSSLQYDYFVKGFFNATEEEKIKFGLIFNDLDAYNMCYDAFNEAEEFYASHAN